MKYLYDEDLYQKEVFKRNLNFYIKLSGKSQKEICAAINENTSTFSQWVNGKALPKISKIQKLADYFDIPKSYLLNETVITANSSDDILAFVEEYTKLNDDNKRIIRYLVKLMSISS